MRWKNASLAMMLPAFLLPSILFPQSARKPTQEDSLMTKRDKQEYAKPSQDSPPELSRFAFLIGKWRCEVNLKQDDGTWQKLKATWEGRYILDGYAIADEYRMTTLAGELLVLGVNLRTYDSKKKAWNMKWLHALGGTWVDLGPEELGGVTADEKSISYSMKEPLAQHAFTRATYTNISANRFTWRGERSNDRKAWEEFLVIEAYRSKK